MESCNADIIKLAILPIVNLPSFYALWIIIPPINKTKITKKMLLIIVLLPTILLKRIPAACSMPLTADFKIVLS